MKLLLTSGGVSNPSIHAALVRLLGQPISECTALAIPTAEWGHASCTPYGAHRFVAGQSSAPMTDLGWAAVGLLELTALPTIPTDRWVPWVLEADALLVDGGDAAYLGHWMRASGLLDLVPRLADKVWVGMSAGSMVMTPRIGADFVTWADAPDDRTLGIVDFSIYPHVGHPAMPGNTLEDAERWARDLGNPAYAVDDDTAFVVVDGEVDVVSEGSWTRL